MQAPSVSVMLVLSALFAGARALPSGAPGAACAAIAPRHAGLSSQPLDSSPFNLDISSFGGDYIPGETYTLTLSATAGTDFRGLLVQARLAADDSPLGGSFSIVDVQTKLSACSPPDSAVTHVGRTDKTSVTLEFTAPPEGTGAILFKYAVVDMFVTFYATIMTEVVQEAAMEIEPLELSFTGDTPMVTDNDVFAQIQVSRPVNLRCEMVTRGAPGMPTITEEQDCTSGEVTFLNVASGEHRVRVIAGDMEAVIRSRVILMPDSPNFCSLNAINKGLTVGLGADGAAANYTIEWRPIGNDVGFVCQIGRALELVKCVSPFTVPAEEGVMRVKVVPTPEMCRNRRPLVFRLK